MAGVAGSPVGGGGRAANPRFKTELCRNFTVTGRCPFGTKCQFAHGAAELRNVDRHPRYKTALCASFWTYGACWPRRAHHHTRGV